MSNKCKLCKEKVLECYRVNSIGQIFCTDECYEEFMSEYPDAPDDHNHPYIDDYEAIRFEYCEWLKFEEELYALPDNKNLLYKVDEMLDSLDSVIDEFFDYYRTEGDDGVFAKEIYNYVKKLEKLQRRILRWRPKRRVLFYLKIEFDEYAFEEAVTSWEQFEPELKLLQSEKLLHLLEPNVHPNDELTFTFYTQAILDEVINQLELHFGGFILSLQVDNAHQCDGCEDIEVITEVNTKRMNGWFFCDTCAKLRFPGFFTKAKLLKELQKCNEEKDLLKIAQSNSWHYYIRKIKRSCRYYNIEFPDWIELEYE